MYSSHFAVSVAEVGDRLPNDSQDEMTNRAVYIKNNRVCTPRYSVWRMQPKEARELAAALIQAASYMERVTPHRPVWRAG